MTSTNSIKYCNQLVLRRDVQKGSIVTNADVYAEDDIRVASDGDTLVDCTVISASSTNQTVNLRDSSIDHPSTVVGAEPIIEDFYCFDDSRSRGLVILCRCCSTKLSTADDQIQLVNSSNSTVTFSFDQANSSETRNALLRVMALPRTTHTGSSLPRFARCSNSCLEGIYCSETCLRKDEDTCGHRLLCSGEPIGTRQYKQLIKVASDDHSMLVARVAVRLIADASRGPCSEQPSAKRQKVSDVDRFDPRYRWDIAMEDFVSLFPPVDSDIHWEHGEDSDDGNEDEDEGDDDDQMAEIHVLLLALLCARASLIESMLMANNSIGDVTGSSSSQSDIQSALLSCLNATTWRQLWNICKRYALVLPAGRNELAERAQKLPALPTREDRLAELLTLQRFRYVHSKHSFKSINTDIASETPASIERRVVRLAQAAGLTSNSSGSSGFPGELEENPFEAFGGIIRGLWPTLGSLPHSCIPTVVVESSPSAAGRVCLVALHDLPKGGQLTAAIIDHVGVPLESRQRALRRRCYPSHCQCLKCQVEMLAGSLASVMPNSLPLTLEEIKRVGDMCMEEGLVPAALRCYDFVLNTPDLNDSLRQEVCLTCGAACLDLGDGLNARKYWRMGVVDQSLDECVRNPMLVEQLSKIEAIDSYVYEDISQLSPLPWHQISSSIRNTYGDSSNGSSLPIYMTTVPVISSDECRQVIAWGEAFASRAGGWSTDRHYAVPTTDIPLHKDPQLLRWFNERMKDTLAPLVLQQFAHFSADPRAQCMQSRWHVFVNDVFLVKYSASGAHASQRYLPLHVDQSTHSLTVALNDTREYTGGGTYFAALKTAVVPDCGHVLSFSGSLVHGGEPIIFGTRYILAVFLVIQREDDVPHLIQKSPLSPAREGTGTSHSWQQQQTCDTSSTQSFSFDFSSFEKEEGSTKYPPDQVIDSQ